MSHMIRAGYCSVIRIWKISALLALFVCTLKSRYYEFKGNGRVLGLDGFKYPSAVLALCNVFGYTFSPDLPI